MPLPVAEWMVDEITTPNGSVLDPFCGTGTSLIAAAARGLNFLGSDMNPLACAIAECSLDAMTPDFEPTAYEHAVQDFGSLISADENHPHESLSNTVDRWYTPDQIRGLAQLSSAVGRFKGDSAHLRMLRLAFSRTARKASLTRNGELKLWKQPEHKRALDPLAVFSEEARKTIWALDALSKSAIASRRGTGQVMAVDSRDLDLRDFSPTTIVTSPPYGDSRTTVAYGNFSVLSRVWLSSVDESFAIDDIHQLDEMHPGGFHRTHQEEAQSNVLEWSQSLLDGYNAVLSHDPNRATQLVWFFADLSELFTNLLAQGPNISNIGTLLGPRRVSGVLIDPGLILAEILEMTHGATHTKRIGRTVHAKRLPKRGMHSEGRVEEMINSEFVDLFELSPRVEREK